MLMERAESANPARLIRHAAGELSPCHSTTSRPAAARKSARRSAWQTPRMAVDVATVIAIERPRDEVFSYTIDPSNATAWYKNIRAVEWETPPPAAVGS